MERYFLFTDGSVNVQTNVGIGAVLLIPENELSSDNLKNKIQTVRFEPTSSTKLELQTLLWALGNVRYLASELVVFTDSQNIVSLMERRQRLEKSNYRSKKNIELKNAELYKEFFQQVDNLNVEFHKIKGHQPSKKKNEIEGIFSMVDKAARKAIRKAHLK